MYLGKTNVKSTHLRRGRSIVRKVVKVSANTTMTLVRNTRWLGRLTCRGHAKVEPGLSLGCDGSAEKEVDRDTMVQYL